ncbi:MAG: hypothetical protein AB7F35_09155 [Acetobacteraceae bacterium]
MRIRLIAATLAACLIGLSAWAQGTPPTRIRGTIASVSGQTMTVNSRDGQKLEIMLNDPLTVSTVTKVDLASVAPGSYIGTATRTLPGGTLQALEVLVFPEGMRGTAEGHFPWDLEPGSMMTNATVTGVVQGTSGRELTLKFKDSSNKVVVPPDAPVVTLAPAQRSDLKPGARVFLSASKNAEGKLAASRVTVEKDGVAPPM